VMVVGGSELIWFRLDYETALALNTVIVLVAGEVPPRSTESNSFSDSGGHGRQETGDCATFTDNKTTLFTALQIDLLGIIAKTWD